ncbi:MAG: hypothetical protein ACXWT0_01855 [Methylobacter sp.]
MKNEPTFFINRDLKNRGVKPTFTNSQQGMLIISLIIFITGLLAEVIG